MKNIKYIIMVLTIVTAPTRAQWVGDSSIIVTAAPANQELVRMINDLGGGGVIAVWKDALNGNLDIYAQRIDANGIKYWGYNANNGGYGLPVCTASDDQDSPRLVGDGVGGAIITWVDMRNSGMMDIYAQRINNDGSETWDPNGVVVCDAADEQYGPLIISDEIEGAIITWIDTRGGMENIYAQRIDAGGTAQWTSNGVLVNDGSGGVGSAFAIVSDGNNGAIVCWTQDDDLFAQRIDAEGNLVWPTGGRVVCDTVNVQQRPAMIADGSGGAFVVWEDSRDGANFSIFGQHLGADGIRQWATTDSNGVVVHHSENVQVNPAICFDGSGGMIVVWQDDRNGTYDIFGKRLNSNGVNLWSSSGAEIAENTSIGSLSLVPDDSGGVVLTWLRASTPSGVYAQRVDGNGNLVWTSGGIQLQAISNPADPAVALDFNGDAVFVWGANTPRDLRARKILRYGTFDDKLAPQAPFGLSADSTIGGALRLNWYANSEGDLHSYKIFVWRGFTKDLVVVDSVPADSLQRIVTGLTPGEIHYAKIIAKDSYGNQSEFSNEVNRIVIEVEPPSAPAEFSFVDRKSDSLRVVFPSVGESTSGYMILRSLFSDPGDYPVDGVTYSEGQSVGVSVVVHYGADTSFIDTGLSAGTRYYYRGFAYSGSGVTLNYRTSSFTTGNAFTLKTEPTAQYVDMVFQEVTSSSFSFYLQEAVPTPYALVLRKQGAEPTGIPVDGIPYTAGDSLGDALIIHSGSGSGVFNQTGLLPGTTYYYSVFTFNKDAVTGGLENYRTVSPLHRSRSTVANEPLSMPNSFISTGRTSSTLDLSLTPFTVRPDGHLILRNPFSSTFPIPDDGASYSAGQSLGQSTTLSSVVYVGSDTAVTDTGLTYDGLYHYAVFAYNGSGESINYYGQPRTLSARTLPNEPTMQPSGAVFSAVTPSSFGVQFQDNAGVSGFLILRRVGSAPTGIPVDGETYAAGGTIDGDTIVRFASGTSFTQEGLFAETNYYYTLFPFNQSFFDPSAVNYLTQSPYTFSVSTLAGDLTTPATNLIFSNVTTSSMSVSFTPATGASGHVVLRRRDFNVTFEPVDGQTYVVGDVLGATDTVVYVGDGTSFEQIGLPVYNRFYYKVFPFTGSGATINYLTSPVLSGSRFTLATEPSEQVASMSLYGVTASEAYGSFDPSQEGRLVLVKLHAPTGDLPTDGIGYTAGDSIGQSRIVHAGDGGSFSISDLQANEVYYVTILAFNGSGESCNYRTENPLVDSLHTLFAEPGLPPAALNFSNVSLSSLTGNIVPSAEGADGYFVLMNTQTPQFTPVDGDANYVEGLTYNGDRLVHYGVDTVFVVSNLLPGVSYAFTIYPYNGLGTLINYNTSTGLVNSQSTVDDTERPVLTSATFAPETVILNTTSFVQVSCNVTDNTGVSGASLSYRSGVAGSTYSSPINMTSVGSGMYEGTISAGGITRNGIQFRVVATDLQNNTDTLYGLIPVNVPENSISTNITGSPYTSGFPEGQWRMISIPLDLDNKKADSILVDMGEPGNKTWRLFSGATDVSSTAHFTLGRAFWLKQIVVPGGRQIALKSGRTAGAEDGKLIIPPGWHQIGNPFTYSIDWETDTDANQFPALKGPIAWDGLKYVGVDQTNGDPTPFTTIQPWNGYWVHNNSTSNITLTINPTGSLGKRLPKVTTPSDWWIQLKVQAGPYEDNMNYVGSAAGAEVGYDGTDLPELPFIGDHVSAYFRERDEDRALTISNRPPEEGIYTWTMHVSGTLTSLEHQLSYETRSVPDGYSIAVYDVSEKTRITEFPYRFRNRREDESHTFKVFVGFADRVTAEVEAFDAALPSNFGLSQNYPNPFNPSTVIPFEVARAGKVQIRIYNMLGQVVATVENRYYDPGRYKSLWDGHDSLGRPVSSGLYICRLEAGRVSKTRKMLLIR